MPATTYPLPDPLVTVCPDWLGWEPCFTGRRVAIKTLFDDLKAGSTLESFLADFPGVSREHATAVLELASRSLGAAEAAE